MAQDQEIINIDLKVPTSWEKLNEKQLRYVFGLTAHGFCHAARDKSFLRKRRRNRKMVICLVIKDIVFNFALKIRSSTPDFQSKYGVVLLILKHFK